MTVCIGMAEVLIHNFYDKATADSDVINTLRPRQNGRHFADAIFMYIFLNGNVWILVKISLKYVPNGPINNIPALVQIMAWRRSGDKPLSEPMMAGLPMMTGLPLGLNELTDRPLGDVAIISKV